MYALALLLASIIGISLGLLGGGGSILTVPVFVYVLGFGAKESIAMSLAVVGVAALVGAVSHWRDGNVNLRFAAIFGAVAMIGTFGGARLAVFFSAAAQLALFAVVMLVAAAFMFRGQRQPVVPLESLPPRKPLALGLIVVEGLAVGVLTGLVGVGGGFLIVPAMVLLARIPMKEAVGTSLLVIAMKSSAGLVGYVDQVDVPWTFLCVFTSVAIGGILFGTWLVRFAPQAMLQRMFAVFLLIMGAFILYQNMGALNLIPASLSDAAVIRGK